MLALIILAMLSPLVIKLKGKKKTTIFVFCTFLLWWILREMRCIPTLSVSKDWWWYGNLIGYLPAYFFGALVGLNYSDLIIQEKYNIKNSTFIGIIMMIVAMSLVLARKMINIVFLIYILEVVAIWLILNGKLFNKKPSKFLNSSFYIYAMHQPILIPIVNKIIVIALRNVTITGYQFVLVKLLGMTIIAIISYLVYLLVQRFCPKKIKFIFTGGRD